MQAFFDLPIENKRQLSRTATNPWGFFDQELTKNKLDWKQILDFGINRDNENYAGTSQWPTELVDFQSTMQAWFDQCEKLALALLARICESLGQQPDALTRYFKPCNSSFLRLNYYPLCEHPADPSIVNSPNNKDPNGHFGISEHTDAGALTLLAQDDNFALQVFAESTWQLVKPRPDSLIINLGDLLQVWSNNRYTAPLHRVIAATNQPRYSAAFFFNPELDCICQPLKNASTQAPDALYKPLSWRQFRQARAAGDYANLGKEAQISDYLINIA